MMVPVALSLLQTLALLGGGEPLPRRAEARLGSLAFAHPGPVSGVAFSADGTRLVTTSSADGVLRVWSVPRGQLIREAKVGGMALADVARVGGEYAVAAGLTKGVHIVDLAGDEVRRLEPRGLSGSMKRVAASPDGRVALGTSRGEVRVWDARGAELGTRTLESTFQVESLSLGDRVVMAGPRTWLGRVPGEGEGAELQYTRAALSRDGTRLAVARKGRVAVVDVKSMATVASVEWGGEPSAIALCGDRVVVAEASGAVWRWDGAAAPKKLGAHHLEVLALAFSPKCDRVVSAGEDAVVRQWDPLSDLAVERGGHAGPVLGLAWVEAGLLSSGWDETVRLWDTSGAGEQRLWTPGGGKCRAPALREGSAACAPGARPEWRGEGRVRALAWSGDRRHYCEADDRALRCFDAGTKRRLWSAVRRKTGKTAAHAIAISPDGRRVASGHDAVYVWKLSDGERLGKLRGHRGDAMSVAWSPDGKRLASGGAAGTILIWKHPPK